MRHLPTRILLAHAALLAACNGQIGEPAQLGGTKTPRPTETSDPAGSGGAPSNPRPCASAPLPLQPARVWRLTHTQYKNTLLHAFEFAGTKVDAFPPDARLEGYANAAEALGASTLLTHYYDQASDEVAAHVVQSGEAFIGCPAANLGTGTCLPDFLKRVGQKSWRRPLTAEEITGLTQLYNTVAGPNGPNIGLKMVVQALVLSPNFLFRTELGPDQPQGATTDLTDLELASALSYTIWDGPPDDALLGLAVSGQLHDPAVLTSEARRLLATTDKAPAALDAFVAQWLKTDALPASDKSQTVFPGFDAAMAQEVMTETNLFVNGIAFDPTSDKSLKTLLTAPYGYVDSKTGPLYGIDSKDATLTRTDFPAGERRGILTQASFLAAHGESDTTNLVGRGSFVYETVLCGKVDPPPAAFRFDPTKITDDMTGREKFEIHTKNPACAGCHTIFDGIGFALETYDGIGRYRTMDKGKKIDPSGFVPMPDGSQITFSNFVDLVDQLSDVPSVYDCYARQYLTYASGLRPDAVDYCEAADIAKQFADSGYKLDALVLAIVSSPGFRTRKL